MSHTSPTPAPPPPSPPSSSSSSSPQKQCIQTTLTVPAEVDQYPITATLFDPMHSVPKQNVVVVITGATGVPQGFYAAYAQYLASQGCRTVTLDYRGIARSRPATGLRGFQARVVPEWQRDVAGVVRAVAARSPGDPIVMVAHSVGGHVAPMVPGLARCLMVGVGTAYTAQLPLPRLQKFVFSVLGPTLAALCGYFPSQRLGLGENLPRGAGTQWTTWSRTRTYHMDAPGVRDAYEACTMPVLSLLFARDTLCSLPNALDFLAFLPHCPRTLHAVPTALGHLNFFRASSADHWPLALPFLLHGTPKFGTHPAWIRVDPGVGGLEWADQVIRDHRAKECAKAKL